MKKIIHKYIHSTFYNHNPLFIYLQLWSRHGTCAKCKIIVNLSTFDNNNKIKIIKLLFSNGCRSDNGGSHTSSLLGKSSNSLESDLGFLTPIQGRVRGRDGKNF